MMWDWDGWTYVRPWVWPGHALVWILLIWAVVAILRRGRWFKRVDHSESILRERYARGELSKEEFTRLKADLGIK